MLFESSPAFFQLRTRLAIEVLLEAVLVNAGQPEAGTKGDI